MESSIHGIIVFIVAVFTHHKLVHGSMRSIIGHFLYDSKSGPAVGTVGKRVGVSSFIIFIVNVFNAVAAGGNVRRYQLEFFFSILTFSYFKILKILERNFFYFDIFNNRSRGFLQFDIGSKFFSHAFIWNIYFYSNSFCCIGNRSIQIIFLRHSIYKRSKTYTLHDSVDIYLIGFKNCFI
ncbi:hypothetical protein ES708_21686 [subsurface metagenome]